jgi:K+-transporting ATPase ATPase C chain
VARDAYRSVLALLVLTLLCGAAYPMTVWGIGQIAFADAAGGSLIERDGRVVGSARLGQAFGGDEWFQPRPSAVDYSSVPAGVDPILGSSGGSNLGPNAQQLADTVRQRLDARAALERVERTQVPVDLVTASASGLDPDISVGAARLQVARVARARNLDPAIVERLVDDHVIGRTLGFLGADRVNVLRLNLALDAVAGGS